MEQSVSYGLEERRNGWVFRFPDNEGSLWRGPYPDRDAAHDAALAEIKDFMIRQVADALGLGN